MKNEARKTAVNEYKEREVRPGIYALRRAETGEVWIGSAPNVDAIENRVRFTLGLGKHRSASLQDAWRQCGDAGLTFEVVEALESGLSDYTRDARLKERLAHWGGTLGGESI